MINFMINIILTLIAALGALLGGYVAIKSRSKIHYAMAITSGLILGLVAFDLLPEIFEGVEHSGIEVAWPMILFVLGFIAFHVIESFVVVHESEEDTYKPHKHLNLGTTRALALAGHSFIDGLSISLAFQINTETGMAVALAVIGHRFADGFDTTSFMIFHKNPMKQIKTMLIAVASMPILGGVVGMIIEIPDSALTLYLSFFAGVLMYVAASNILPQAHAKSNSKLSIVLVIAGAAAMLLITQLIGEAH